MAAGNIAPVDSLGTLTNLLSLFKGSSSSSTTKSNVSPEGMNALIQQILGSAQGLASVAGGQKSAGIYNSTTNQLLVNDLITRSAGELAKQQAGTTTTTKTPPKVGAEDILTLILAQSGSKLLGPTVKGIGKKAGLDDLGAKLAESLGLGTSSSAADSMLIDSTGQGIAEIGTSQLGAQAIESLAGSFFSDTASSAAADAATSESSGSIVDFLSGIFGG